MTASPFIGVTTTRITNQFGYSMIAVTEAYIKALLKAGAIPVMIPLGLDRVSLSSVLSGLQGVLFTGGGDIHPSCYQSQDHPLVCDVDTDRDQMEIRLFQEVVKEEKPFLGICRGMQLVNVALGGSLYEDIQDQKTGSIKHNYYPNWPRQFLAHQIDIVQGSHLSRILNSTDTAVNSLHHQGVLNLSHHLKASAFAPDGLVEACELNEYPFGLAVQWHPEWLPDNNGMSGLFRAFIEASTSNR